VLLSSPEKLGGGFQGNIRVKAGGTLPPFKCQRSAVCYASGGTRGRLPDWTRDAVGTGVISCGGGNPPIVRTRLSGKSREKFGLFSRLRFLGTEHGIKPYRGEARLRWRRLLVFSARKGGPKLCPGWSVPHLRGEMSGDPGRERGGGGPVSDRNVEWGISLWGVHDPGEGPQTPDQWGGSERRGLGGSLVPLGGIGWGAC